MTRSRFTPVLRKATRVLGKRRPPVPPTLPNTLDYEETDGGLFGRFWFRPRGCTHSIGGGCTMCDYCVSTETDDGEPRRSVAVAPTARPRGLVVGFGMESLAPWGLQHCINKNTHSGGVEQAVKRTRRCPAGSVAKLRRPGSICRRSPRIACVCRDKHETRNRLPDHPPGGAATSPTAADRHLPEHRLAGA